MCSPKVMPVVEPETARRRFLRSMGAAAVGLGAAAVEVHAQPQNTGSSRVSTTGLDEVLRRTDRRKQAGDYSHPLIFIGGLKTRGGSGSPVRALALV